MSVIHCYSEYETQDPETIRRQTLARETWLLQPWSERPVRDEMLPRLWKEEGRQVPYLRDLFDYSSQGCADNDIVIHTNSDIHVRSDCTLRVSFALQFASACYCFRRDFSRITSRLPDEDYAKGYDYPGHDLTAFRAGWWRSYREVMPDMLVGREGWDPCMRLLIDRTNMGREVRLRDLIAHERHPSLWENPANRHRLRGQKYNLQLAKAFLSSNGVNPRAHGIP